MVFFLKAEVDDGNLSDDKSDYYTMEELHQLVDPTIANLARMFSNIRFRKNVKYACKGSGYMQHERTEIIWVRIQDKDS